MTPDSGNNTLSGWVSRTRVRIAGATPVTLIGAAVEPAAREPALLTIS